MKFTKKILTVYGVLTVGGLVVVSVAVWLYFGNLTPLAFLIPIFVLVLSAFLVAVWEQMVKPIDVFVQQMKEISQSEDLRKKIEVVGGGEIAMMAAIFNQMAKRVADSSEVLQEKVGEKTNQLARTVRDSEEKNRALEETKKSVMTLLSEVDQEKKRVMQERDKTNAILYSIGDGVFVIDTEYKVLLINQIAADMSGFSTEECLGKRYDLTLNFVYEKDEPAAELIQVAMETGRVTGKAKHTVLVKKSGEKIAVDQSVAPFKDTEGKVAGVVVVFRDVTKERQIDRMKTEFISLASHQLRTPLSAMKWFSEMLMAGDAGVLTQEQKEMVSNIYQSNDRMIDLVNALLNVSRIESGRIIIDPKPTDLSQLVREVEVEIRNKIEAKKQNLVISSHPDLPKINIDPKLIREVYLNLLTNAIKYSPEGGEIDVMISVKDGDVISQVSDNGYGIPKKEFGRVFEKFYRGENVIKKETEGTGLGLYLVKAIIESSGGQIWFESEENKGTSFWFSLPLAGTQPRAGEVALDTGLIKD